MSMATGAASVEASKQLLRAAHGLEEGFLAYRFFLEVAVHLPPGPASPPQQQIAFGSFGIVFKWYCVYAKPLESVTISRSCRKHVLEPNRMDSRSAICREPLELVSAKEEGLA